MPLSKLRFTDGKWHSQTELGKTLNSSMKALNSGKCCLILKERLFQVTSYDFIFSDKIFNRVTRHIVLWAANCIYFFIQPIVPNHMDDFISSHTYLVALTSVFNSCRCVYFQRIATCTCYFQSSFLLSNVSRQGPREADIAQNPGEGFQKLSLSVTDAALFILVPLTFGG